MAQIPARQREKQVKDLLDAALDGDLEKVEKFLDIVPVDQCDGSGNTALSEASVGGHVAVCELLLSHGADVNAVNKQKRAALHRAAFHGYADVCKLLLSCGADATLRDSVGETASIVALDEKTRAVLDAPVVLRKLDFKPKPRVEPDSAKAEPDEADKAEAEPRAEPPRKRIYRYLVVRGAGEGRLNGAYAHVPHSIDDRWEHIHDKECYLTYSHTKQEWVLGIQKYKRGNALYRVMERRAQYAVPEYREEDGPVAPMPKAAPEPAEGAKWLVWFGTGPAPTVEGVSTDRDMAASPPTPTEDAPGEETAPSSSKVDANSEQSFHKAVNIPITEAESEETSRASADPAVAAAAAEQLAADAAAKPAKAAEDSVSVPIKEAEPGPKREFLEVTNSLQIVAEKDQGSTAKAASKAGSDVMMPGAAGRIVETADGLFAPEELESSENPVDTWMPECTAVPPEWEEVMLAKQKAADLFVSGDFEESAALFSGCIEALPLLTLSQAAEADAEDAPAASSADLDEVGATGRIVEISDRQLKAEEARQLHSVLLSNRALVCLKMSRWDFAVRDCDRALALDPRLYKAIYRRAYALKELGRLDDALADATKVCEYYQTQPAPNPEAWDLRESIIAALKKETNKWKTGKNNPRWNKATPTRGRVDLDPEPKKVVRAAVPKTLGAPTAAPRNYGDTERHLLYFRRHGGGTDYPSKLTPEALKTSRWSPDAFGTFVKLLAGCNDDAHVAALLKAAVPDTLTWDLLEDKERTCALALLERVEKVADLSSWKNFR
jgi:tetratricopeptide (TPR) repeat protein